MLRPGNDLVVGFLRRARRLFVETCERFRNGPSGALVVGIPIIAVPWARMTGCFAGIKPDAASRRLCRSAAGAGQGRSAGASLRPPLLFAEALAKAEGLGIGCLDNEDSQEDRTLICVAGTRLVAMRNLLAPVKAQDARSVRDQN